MPATENKALLQRYIAEVWHKGNVAALDNFLAADYQRHVSPTAPPLTLDGQKQRLAGFRSAFPDIALALEEVFAESDRVVFRSTLRGTPEGEFLGIAPTGSRVTVAVLDMVRIQDGRIVEQWGGPDVFDLLRQLGATVTSAQSRKAG
jgi:predicted ester cyclase